MKTLYVSDLDGTLFNRQKKLSDYTVKVLNGCIETGMEFTVATARMPYGCDYRLENVALQTPGILTNGVFLYEFSKKKYLHVESISSEAAKKVVNIIENSGFSCFVYIYNKGEISIYYGDKELEGQTQYYSQRALGNCHEVRLIEQLETAIDKGDVVYLALTGENEKLQPLCQQIEEIKGIHFAYYLNIYNGLYCLEIFSEKASKQNALKRLKKFGGYDEIVVFGDNLNDLSMIEIADRSYAPENALKEVKQCVTDVLDDCDNDGVARFLEKEWKKQL